MICMNDVRQPMSRELQPIRHSEVVLDAFSAARIRYSIPPSLSGACRWPGTVHCSGRAVALDSAILPWVLHAVAPRIADCVIEEPLPSDARALGELLRCPPPKALDEWLRASRFAVGFEHAKLRSGFTWVGGPHPQVAWLVPPPPEMIRELLSDLAVFLKVRSFSTLGEILVLAYQLIHIHPFSDGNGRVARCLVMLAADVGGIPGEGRWLALSMSRDRERTATWMERMRQGDVVGAEAACLARLEEWFEVRNRCNKDLQAVLNEAFSAPPLKKKAECFQQMLLCCGRLSWSELLRQCGGSRTLAAKYRETILHSGTWKEDEQGFTIPSITRIVRAAVRAISDTR